MEKNNLELLKKKIKEAIDKKIREGFEQEEEEEYSRDFVEVRDNPSFHTQKSARDLN